MNEKSEKLLALYQSLMDKVAEQYRDDSSLSINALYEAITHSREFLALKRKASEDELALVEGFLRRDIDSFIKQRMQTDLSYSPSVIGFEQSLWHWLGEISDRSQVEWHELAQQFKQAGVYHTGDVVSQGRLSCTQCGQGMSIEFTNVVPECPNCDNREFTREALMP
ncbi:zinc ribbon-containing protein [Shewanella avicenniae]|uniref:Zinc ribbon-containing protein n=1 Tax=Shewanella avicenniae TaxID=2814294 RepID=A0ABX7QT14_9GAMM|nr:zinc ribbon-containing protein [Shewanella avicenniae]QSX34607.1 zinc ribbon-containing protein [Shewanella avicenniae]